MQLRSLATVAPHFVLLLSCAASEVGSASSAPDARNTVLETDAGSVTVERADALVAQTGVGGNATILPDATGSEAIEGGAVMAPTPAPLVDNVVLWLDAAKGVIASEGHVSKWTDQSTMLNDAVQSVVGAQPLRVADGFNGRPTIRFEAARKTVLLVPDAQSLHFGTGDLTVEVVVGYHNRSKNGMPVDHLDGWGYVFNKMVGNRLGVGLMGNWPTAENMPIGSQFGCETTEQGGSLLSKDMGYNDDKPRLWAMRRTGTIVELRRNGAVDNSGRWSPPVDVDAMGTPPMSIGARLYQGQQSASFPLDGDVAEIVAVKGTVATDQLSALENYLRDKYALQP